MGHKYMRLAHFLKIGILYQDLFTSSVSNLIIRVGPSVNYTLTEVLIAVTNPL